MGFLLPLFVSSLLFALLPGGSFASEPLFAVATRATPVLNTPEFGELFGGKDGQTVRKDACGQIKSLEFVALPGTVFTIEAELKRGTYTVYRVVTIDYPYPSIQGYFVDSRAVRTSRQKLPERPRALPSKDTIIHMMKSRAGAAYLWGGNIASGVPELIEWYHLTGKNIPEPHLWRLEGVDCSGLLYEATGGYTPRNTSSLVSYGKGVKVSGKNANDIAALLDPLDLIVWPGHVMIVLDRKSIIESSLDCNSPEEGVRIRPLTVVLEKLLTKRRPVDIIGNDSKEFVVRRWYREGSSF